MTPRGMLKISIVVAVAALLAGSGAGAAVGTSSAPSNTAPNPYMTIAHWAQLPDGRMWGSTAGVEVAPNGLIWAYDRCGANNCADSPLDPVVEFDSTGKALRAFGAGLFVQPHGLFVDSAGNVWVTDDLASADHKKGLQVFKFSPEGKILMTLGRAGTAGEGPDTFGAPTDVLVAANGDIYVTDGHNGCKCPNARVVRFSKDGKFIQAWGKQGAGPGEFDGPHSLAMDAKGRLYVADRTNNRIQIFTPDGKFIAEWKQFGRPSGLYIRKNMLYVSDSESRDADGYGHNPGCRRGIRIGSVKDGKVVAFIPDPNPTAATSTAEGIAVDQQGNIYGAEVGPKDLKKYTRR